MYPIPKPLLLYMTSSKVSSRFMAMPYYNRFETYNLIILRCYDILLKYGFTRDESQEQILGWTTLPIENTGILKLFKILIFIKTNLIPPFTSIKLKKKANESPSKYYEVDVAKDNQDIKVSSDECSISSNENESENSESVEQSSSAEEEDSLSSF